MKQFDTIFKGSTNRRSFLKNGAAAASVATVGAGLLPGRVLALEGDDDDGAPITRGDLAIVRFLQAIEQVEADLWIQYSELGGIQDNEVSGLNGGNAAYKAALSILDGDMSQYIHDNTDDEISHVRFLGNYLESKGAEPVNLDRFRTLPSSKAFGARDLGRLTNLTKLTIDTSFWTRYRSITNPDVDANAPFLQAVQGLNVAQHTSTLLDVPAPSRNPQHPTICFQANRKRCARWQRGYHQCSSSAGRIRDVPCDSVRPAAD